jgi:hypothetical protein
VWVRVQYAEDIQMASTSREAACQPIQGEPIGASGYGPGKFLSKSDMPWITRGVAGSARAKLFPWDESRVTFCLPCDLTDH